jgi:flagellar biosynthesis protein FlhA
VQQETGEELVPKVLALGTVQQVMRNLLREGVGLRDASTILDAMALGVETTKDPEELTSLVRVALGPAICSGKFDVDGRLRVFALGPGLEERLRAEQRDGGPGPDLVLALAEALRKAFSAAPAEPQHVVLCSPSVRAATRRVVEKVFPTASVLSHGEVPDTVPLVRVGTVA